MHLLNRGTLHAALLSLLIVATAAQSIDEATNILKGVLPEDMARYLEESSRSCDSASRYLSFGDINDNFCDCADGSDEPGTSACSHMSAAKFSCLNAGFQSTFIPTSRVGDGICDCCDGSDEAAGICTDTCLTQAASERDRLELIIAAYNAGSQVRRSYLTEVKKLRSRASDGAIERAQERVAALEASQTEIEQALATEEELERQDQDTASRMEAATWGNLLKFHSLSENDIGSIFLSFFNLVEATIDDIKEVTDQMSPTEDDGNGHERDGYADDHDYYNHHEYDDYAGEHIPDSSEPIPETDEESNAQVYVERCALLTNPASGELDDERLAALCVSMSEAVSATNFSDNHAYLLRFIIQFVSKNRLGFQFFIILGYYFNYETSIKSDSFYREKFPDMDARLDGQINQDAEQAFVCPIEFRKVDWLCDNPEEYQHMLYAYDPSPRLREAAENLRNQKKEVENLIEKRNEALTELVTLKTRLEEYADFVEFLAIEDVCVSTVDGKFKYTMCTMKNVEQCELVEENHEEEHNIECSSSVSLGDFKGFSSAPSGDVKMSFSDGTHCHAFGARKSEVIITCGPENVLLDATEPSTCFYQLHMESPAACTQAFAKFAGIASFIQD